MKNLAGVLMCWLAVGFIAGAPCGAAMPIESGFDADLEGWTSNLAAAVAHASPGGNPGGYARFIETTPEETATLFAPASILTDFSSDHFGEMLSWDQKIFDTGSNIVSIAPFLISITSSGFSLDGAWIPIVGATFIGDLATGETAWLTQSTTLDSSGGWLFSGGASFPSLLDTANTIAIQFEVVNNGAVGDRQEHIGIDNFIVTPEPASAALLLLGFAGLLRRKMR